jgi:PilZ domain
MNQQKALPARPSLSASSTVGNKDSERSAKAPGSEKMELDLPCQIQFPNSPKTISDVRVRRVNHGFIKLFSRNKLPINSRVQILFKGKLINAEVTYCNVEQDGYSVGTTFGAPGAVRRELRVPVDFPALLTLPQCSTGTKAKIVDMSPSGLGMLVPVEIPIGTGVAIDFAHGTAFGEIRHCVPQKGYYRAGVALEEFIPVHNSKAAQPTLADVPTHSDPKTGLLDSIRQSVATKLKFRTA